MLTYYLERKGNLGQDNVGHYQIHQHNAHQTSPITILEPQNPWIDQFYAVGERRATDFKALKLSKRPSGFLQIWPCFHSAQIARKNRNLRAYQAETSLLLPITDSYMK